MAGEIEFDRDLFRGVAEDYDRFRVPYPQSMLDDLLSWTRPSGVVESKARVLGAGHIRAIALRAEDLDAPTNGFELITIGNAFHRLKRDLVVANAYSWLAPGRVLALLLSSPPWVGDESWQRTFSGLLDEWKERVGAGARIPAGWDQVRKDRPDLDVLAANGFEPVRAASFSRCTSGRLKH